MKKFIKIFILTISLFALVACKSKTVNYFFEITGQELDKNFAHLKGTHIYALYNPEKENTKQFLADLKELATNKKSEIYYYDVTKNASTSIFSLQLMVDVSLVDNCFMVTEDSNLVALAVYEDYNQMAAILDSYETDEGFVKESESDKEKYLERAEELFDEGRISSSYFQLKKAWTLDRAKQFYDEKEIFMLINTWISEAKVGKKYYQELYIDENDDFFTTTPIKNLKSMELISKKQKNYRYTIKDDIIYTSEDDKEEKETYKIIELTKDKLILLDLKTQKEISYVRKD